MPNIKISDLPDVTLPLDAPNVFLEVQATEAGEDVSRKVSAELLQTALGLDASFVTVGLNAALPNERVLTAGTDISIVDGGPNSTITINAIIPVAPGGVLPLGTVDGAGLFWDDGNTEWEERIDLTYDDTALRLFLQNDATQVSMGVGNLSGGGSGAFLGFDFRTNFNPRIRMDTPTGSGAEILVNSQMHFFSGASIIFRIHAGPLSTSPALALDHSGTVARIFTGPAQGDIEMFANNGTQDIRFAFDTGLKIQEKAAAHADIATYGQFWVRDDVPNTPMFTDDAGEDFELNFVGSSLDTFNYQYDDDITLADPGAGFFSLNSLTPSLVTAIAISDTDADGNDLTADLERIDRGYVFTLRDPTDLTRFSRYTRVGTSFDGGTFWIFSLAVAETDAAFVDQSDISVQIDNTPFFETNDFGAITGTLPIWDQAIGQYVVDDNTFRFTTSIGFFSQMGSNQNLRLQSSFDVQCGQPFFILERVAADTSVATWGQVWVRDDVPNNLMFTDDAGNDFAIGGSLAPVPFVIDQHDYQFSTSVAGTDPGSGFLRFNNATPALITQFNCSDITSSGVDIDTDIFENVEIGSTLRVVDADDLTVYFTFTVTSLFDGGGFHIFGVNHKRGDTLPANNANITIQVTQEPYFDLTNQVPQGGSLMVYDTTTDQFDSTQSRGTITRPGVGETQLATSDSILRFFSSSRITTNVALHVTEQSATDALILIRTGGNYLIGTGATSAAHLDLSAHNGALSVRINDGSTLMILETANALPDILTYGQFWVRNDAPNTPMFTDDVGTDFVLNAGVPDPLTLDSGIFTNAAPIDLVDTDVALVVGGPGALSHIEIGAVAIQKKNDATTAGTLDINPLGGNVDIGPQSGTGQVEIFGSASSMVRYDSVAIAAFQSIPLFLLERVAAAADVATWGQFWVRDDVPNTPMFTDDAGNDFVLNASGGAGISGTPVNNQIAIWVDAANIEGDPDLTFAASVLTMTNASGVLTITRGITDVTISNLAAGGDIFYNTLADHVFQIAGVTLFEIDNGGARFLFNNFGVFFEERSTAGPDLATYGQLWVDNTTPQRFTFTGEDGVDKIIMNLFDAQQVDGFQDFRGQNLQQAGFLRFTDNINLEFGTGIDVQIDFNGTNFTTDGPAASLWLVTGFDQLRIDMTLGMNEQAAPDGNVAGVGQWWVRSAAPARPMFTDDTDIDQEMDPSRSDLNTQNGNYTFLITDKGQTIYKASGGAGETYTIPASGSVAYQIGTWIAIDNDGGGDLTIAITTDVLVGTDGATGSRTLGDNHRALIQKIGATRWRYQASDL